MQVQTGCGPGFSQEVSWLGRCTDVVRACLQVVHGVAHELETVTDVSGEVENHFQLSVISKPLVGWRC